MLPVDYFSKPEATPDFIQSVKPALVEIAPGCRDATAAQRKLIRLTAGCLRIRTLATPRARPRFAVDAQWALLAGFSRREVGPVSDPDLASHLLLLFLCPGPKASQACGAAAACSRASAGKAEPRLGPELNFRNGQGSARGGRDWGRELNSKKSPCPTTRPTSDPRTISDLGRHRTPGRIVSSAVNCGQLGRTSRSPCASFVKAE
ncbi:hypothetical protein VTI74DRAFT_1784 [Chaetomium olivicolor]